MGLHGGASAAGGRQAKYCGHARGQARRPLVTWHAQQAALRMEKVSTQQPGTTCRSASARNAREGETRASRTTTPASDQSRGCTALVLPARGPLRRQILLHAVQVGAVALPKEETNDMLAGSYGTIVARLPAFFAVSYCSHAVTRVSDFSHHRHHTLAGLGSRFFSPSNAVPWPRFLRVRGIHSFEGSSRTSGYHGRLQSKPGPDTAVCKGEDQTSVEP